MPATRGETESSFGSMNADAGASVGGGGASWSAPREVWNAATGPKDDDGDEDEDEDEDDEEDEEEEEVTMAAALAALAALAAVDWPLSASLVPSPSDCCRLQRVKVASAG